MAGAISRGVDGEGQDGFRDKYWLWDLWVPAENTILVKAYSPLRDQGLAGTAMMIELSVTMALSHCPNTTR